ncbi:hypothetical protein vseg_009826 [Gypsophila vaccaria]
MLNIRKPQALILTIGLILAFISIVESTTQDPEPTSTTGDGPESKGPTTIGQCLDENKHFKIDSNSKRRILTENKYISYGALNKNKVPCSRRGLSYYNCQFGAHANPYRRGCHAMTRCKRFSGGS